MNIEIVRSNIFKLQKTMHNLKDELRIIEAMPERNLNGFSNINRTRCLQRVKRKMKLNENALQNNLNRLSDLTK